MGTKRTKQGTDSLSKKDFAFAAAAETPSAAFASKGVSA
jgi:hypothetical protein